jgi:hypothetical protein
MPVRFPGGIVVCDDRHLDVPRGAGTRLTCQAEGGRRGRADDRERRAGDRDGGLVLAAPPAGVASRRVRRQDELCSRRRWRDAARRSAGGRDHDPALGALDDLVRGRVRILISKPFHTRSAEPLWGRYRRAKARIYGHPEVATRLGDASGFEAVTSGHDVGGVARFHAIGRPPRSEQPVEILACRALVFGDAVVETGGGELRVWEDPLDSERRRRWWQERYLPTLERLAALEAGHVLVTHGQAVLGNGAAALRRALERDPWQRPKR